MFKRLALTAIKLFQKTRIFRAGSCRFYPSCSDYACAAIEGHGVVAGSMLALWRVLRCQPLHPGGIDMVPERLAILDSLRKQKRFPLLSAALESRCRSVSS